MKRREFLRSVGPATIVGATAARAAAALSASPIAESRHPRAIARWEFSWFERRWPGAGYEDWDRALDELKERG